MNKLIVILIFLNIYLAKQLTKIINLSSLFQQPHSHYLGKFGINIGQGIIKINFLKHNYSSTKSELYNNLKIGLLIDEQYTEFINTQLCINRQKLFKEKYKLNFVDSIKGQKQFKIKQSIRQHLWYLYIYDCDFKISQTNANLKVQIIMSNNKSYVSSNQQLISIYLLLLILWCIQLFLLKKIILKIVQQSTNHWQKIFISFNLILIGFAYFFKILQLLLFIQFEINSKYIYVMYLLIRYVSEGIIVSSIVAIGWGWTLVHLKHDKIYVIIGIIITIINMAVFIIQYDIDELDTSHHKYDTINGRFLLFLRILIWLLFITGIFRSLTLSVGKIKHFLKNFFIFGSIYLLGWPIGVIFSEFMLPYYYHYQIITIIQQICHLVSIGLICYLYGSQNSSYCKVSIKDDDILPYQKK